MQIKQSLVGLTALAFTATALPVSGGHESRSSALAVKDGLFEVFAEYSDNSIYWCGAATYAMGQLGATATQRVFVWQTQSPSVGKPGKKSVKFALTPPPGPTPGDSYTPNVDTVGQSLSVSQAKQTCNELTASG